MAYQPMNTFSMDPSQAIYLYTIPLKHDPVNGKVWKTIGMFAHWAVCIQGVCFEVRAGVKERGEPKFLYKAVREQKWREGRRYKDREGPDFVGYMSKPYTAEVIDDVASQIWEKTLKKKYMYDENNCQSFARLLIEVIGDPNAKVELPHFFDKWVDTACITRDAAIVSMATGMTLVSCGLVTFWVDFGATAAVGVGLALKSRKARHVKNAQKEIGEDLSKHLIE